MKGQTVRLELDLDPTDRYGRTLAWVWAGDSLVNETMVARGRAVMFTVPPNVRYIDRIRTAQILARRDGLGLHGSGALECEPVQFRRRECGGKAESP